MERVAKQESAIDVNYEGNEVEVEIDITFDAKRRLLINRFQQAYDRDLVNWPRGFPQVKKNCYRLGK